MLRFALSVLLLTPAALRAEPPKVLADIAPVHSLVAQVMGDLGAPTLLLRAGASPHDYALRPSDARALNDAEVMIWVGEGLTPWLQDPIDDFTGDATVLTLLETDGWDVIGLEAGHDDHDHDHDHGDTDPHAWLDPDVAQVWLTHIAAAMTAADPENGAIYARNADAARAEIVILAAEIDARLTPLRSTPYLVAHDAYGYFARRFSMPASGAIALSDAQTPSAARIANLQAILDQDAITCIMTDPQVDTRWAALVGEGTPVRTAQVDALGASIPAGPDHYAAMLTQMAAQFESCLTP